MKWLIRSFFKTVRFILGPVVLLTEKLTTPRAIERPEDEQQALDDVTRNLALYQFRTCPFCVKVRREIKRLSLNIETLDAQHDQENRTTLKNEGGQVKVPCLRITRENGEREWLYESSNIIQYLKTLAG
jgi:glutaredoxin